MEIDEQGLIERCKEGDLGGFGKLYDLYADRIYKFVYYRTHHKETAEDIVSQTFIKALERIESYSFDKGSFSAWLYRIARNNVIDHYRTHKETSDIEDAWDLKAKQFLEKDLDIKMQIEKVQEYLGTLSSEQRDVVIMRVWDQLSYKEISEITGKSEASLKMSFSRTMTVLQQKVPLALLLLTIIKFKIYG